MGTSEKTYRLDTTANDKRQPTAQPGLELLLTSLIAELPEQPVKELKKLLEIYSELLSVNNSKVTDERILQLLEIWKNTANLKKVIVSINR